MADEKPLAEHTKAELADLAAANDVADFPASGTKDEMIAALEAAGVGPQPLRTYRFRLKEDVEGQVASFQAGPKAIELDAENSTFETTDKQLAAGLRDVWFLEEESE